MKCNTWPLLMTLALPATPAQALSENLDTTVSLRTDAWSGSRQLDDRAGLAQASAWGQLKLDLSTAGKLVGSGWLRAQTQAPIRAPRGRVRELYWSATAGPLAWKLGRQIVAWGRADGINPTDNLSPRDFTLLTPEDSDSRHGNEAAQLDLKTSWGSFQALGFVRAASHTLPLPEKPGVRYAIERAPRQPQWALKWEPPTTAIDASLSYFEGTDPTPDLSLKSISTAGLELAVRNNPVRIWGADISFTRGTTVWRGELALMDTASQGAFDFSHKKSQAALVAGAEWRLSDSTTLGLQGTLQKVMHHQNPNTLPDPMARELAQTQTTMSNQARPTQWGFTWRLASRFLNEKIMAETNGAMSFPTQSGVWRNKIDYAANDQWRLLLGTDLYFGPKTSFFGQLSKNSVVYVQARYGW